MRPLTTTRASAAAGLGSSARRAFLALVALVVGPLAASTAAAQMPVAGDTERGKLYRLAETRLAALAHHDWTALERVFPENAKLVGPQGAAETAATLRKKAEEATESVGTQTISGYLAKIFPGATAAFATYDLEEEIVRDGKKATRRHAVTEIYEKRAGEWVILHVHVSTRP